MRMSQTLGIALVGMLGLTFSGVAWADNSCHDDNRSRHHNRNRNRNRNRHDDFAWWQSERAARQAHIDSYIADNAEDWNAFKNTPVGNSGVPTIMLRLFPEIFPDIWGPYEEFMSIQGFGPDGIEPDNVLPLGIGRMDSATALAVPPEVPRPVFLQSSNLSCAGCHLGRVNGPDGETVYLPGAPNGQFGPFRGSVYATVTDDSGRYTGDTFREALAALPLGSLYPTDPLQEAVERGAFNLLADVILASLQAGSVAGAERFHATITTHVTNNVPNPPDSVPGNLDAIGFGIALVVDPEVLTPAELAAVLPVAPAPVDIMAVWRQFERPSAQWDGSIPGKLHRNLAASLGVIGNPAAVNVPAAIRTTRFTENLPSAVYPFNVKARWARRGKRIYKRACAACHAEDNNEIFDVAYLGTDENRSLIWTDYTVAALGAAVTVSCQGDPACDDQPEPVIINTGGYMATPLSGIWASAPYLHNGSVPTLRALLTGDRPDVFCRGTTAYDQYNVGFSVECPDSPVPGIGAYDTSQAGHSNAGHVGPEFNGYINWRRHPRKLNYLLEYLKTL